MTKRQYEYPSTANMTPVQMLDAYDRFMRGAEITAQDHVTSRAVAHASAFAAGAHIIAGESDQGTHALCRSFLLGLIDPLHPDLDYLRRDPASGSVERAKREVQANG